MDNIKLYNHFHNGDIFFSRILISLLYENFNIEFFHNLKSPLFLDLPKVKESNGIPIFFQMHENPIFTSDVNDVKVINTWIGQYFNKYTQIINQGCSFENHFKLASDICEKIGINANIDTKYLPRINSDLIPNVNKINNKIELLRSDFNKLVLFCNGNVHSGQASNFSFTNYIIDMSKKFPNYLFLITEPINFCSENIITTSSLTNTSPDLVHIGHISKFCDVIIGRASGPYCFSQIYENLENENKVFCAFCTYKEEGIFYQDAKSKYVWTNNYSEQNIIDNLVKSIII